MYLQGRQFVDPEGILSTIPAVSQVMIGFVCGKIIIDIKDNDRRMLNLFLIGTTLLFVGYFVIDLFHTEKAEIPDGLTTTEYLNPDLPDAKMKGDGIRKH